MYDKNSLSLTKVTSITLHIHKLKILHNKKNFKSKFPTIKLSGQNFSTDRKTILKISKQKIIYVIEGF